MSVFVIEKMNENGFLESFDDRWLIEVRELWFVVFSLYDFA
jgi:hypothetical protein